jgi:hypothetical protein
MNQSKNTMLTTLKMPPGVRAMLERWAQRRCTTWMRREAPRDLLAKIAKADGRRLARDVDQRILGITAAKYIARTTANPASAPKVPTIQ